MESKLVSMSKEESVINAALYQNNKAIFEMIKPHIEQLIGLKFIEIREGERHHSALIASEQSSIVDCKT